MSEYGPRPEDINKEPNEPTKPKRPTNEFNASGMPPWKSGIPHNELKPQGPAPWKAKPPTPPPFPRPEVAPETPEQAQERLEKGKRALEGAKTAFGELNQEADILMAEIKNLKNRKVLASPQQVKRLRAEVNNLVETKYHNLASLVEEDSKILHTPDRGEFTQLIEKIKTKYRSLRKEMNTDLEEIEKGSAINRVARWFKRDS